MAGGYRLLQGLGTRPAESHRPRDSCAESQSAKWATFLTAFTGGPAKFLGGDKEKDHDYKQDGGRFTCR